MQRFGYYIMLLVTLCAQVSCSNDTDFSTGKVEYCIRADWENGKVGGTRSLTSLLGNGGNDLVMLPEDYPATINVTCDGHDFILSRSATLTACSSHQGFFNGYTSNFTLMDKEAQKGVTATASLDGGLDALYCNEGDAVLDGSHLKLNLHHSKALLRLAFRVSEKYDRIRFIRVKSVAILNSDNSTALTMLMKDEGLVPTKDAFSCAAYSYIDPTKVTAHSNLSISCTYDIYDKDSSSDQAHIIRQDEKATNTIQLELLLNNAPVNEVLAGYYYDLNITLDPDYLQVLSDHDNKHMTIE